MSTRQRKLNSITILEQQEGEPAGLTVGTKGIVSKGDDTSGRTQQRQQGDYLLPCFFASEVSRKDAELQASSARGQKAKEQQ